MVTTAQYIPQVAVQRFQYKMTYELTYDIYFSSKMTPCSLADAT